MYVQVLKKNKIFKHKMHVHYFGAVLISTN